MNSSLEIFCVQKLSSFRDKLNFHFKIISYLNIHYHSNFSSKILDFQALLDMLTFFKGIYTSSGSIVTGYCGGGDGWGNEKSIWKAQAGNCCKGCMWTSPILFLALISY